MMMKSQVLLTVLVLSLQCRATTPTDCVGLPSIDLVYQIVKNTFEITLRITDTLITCVTQGTMKDMYQYTSMIIGIKDYRNQTCLIVLEMECVNNNHYQLWDIRTWTSINTCIRKNAHGLYSLAETTSTLAINRTRFDCYNCTTTMNDTLDHCHGINIHTHTHTQTHTNACKAHAHTIHIHKHTCKLLHTHTH